MNNRQSLSPIVNPLGKTPVGLSNFAKLAQGDYCFVDKTLFIKEILDAGDDVILLTRPRRFGKTLNMSMLQHFLQQPAEIVAREAPLGHHLLVPSFQRPRFCLSLKQPALVLLHLFGIREPRPT